MNTQPRLDRAQSSSRGCGAGYGTYSKATAASAVTCARSPRQASSTSGVTAYIRAFITKRPTSALSAGGKTECSRGSSFFLVSSSGTRVFSGEQQAAEKAGLRRGRETVRSSLVCVPCPRLRSRLGQQCDGACRGLAGRQPAHRSDSRRTKREGVMAASASARRHLAQGRFLLRAARLGDRAARVEAAARRPFHHTGDLALQYDALEPSGRVDREIGRDQRRRVR